MSTSKILRLTVRGSKHFVDCEISEEKAVPERVGRGAMGAGVEGGVMIAIQDWKRGAAADIIDAEIRGGYDGRYRESAITQIIGIIAKHAPFKPDVAYMLVPRCDGCRHWQSSHPSEGVCRAASNSEKFWTLDDLMTNPDFGCVQFEAK